MHFGTNTDVNQRITTEYSNKQIKKDPKNQVKSEKTDIHQTKLEKTNYQPPRQSSGDSVKVEVIGGVVAGLFLRFLMYLL